MAVARRLGSIPYPHLRMSKAARALIIRNRRGWFDQADGPLWPSVRAELHYAFQPPFDVISVVLINMALALGVWFFIDPDIVLDYTSLIFLPIALASWAYSDVPATNLFGVRAEQIVERLRQPERVRRIMTVENLALWILVSPLCLLLSLGLMPSQHRPMMSLAIAVAVMCLPFTYLGLAAIMAPLLPFHPLPWRERLHRRDTWVRYCMAIGIAYFGITWPASLLSFTPAIFIVRYVGSEPIHYFLAAVLATPWCLFTWRVGLHISSRITQRRAVYLAEFLADPTRG